MGYCLKQNYLILSYLNNYNIISSAIIQLKANHLPKKTQRFNKYNIKKNGCHLHYLNQLYIKINFIGIGNLQQTIMIIK